MVSGDLFTGVVRDDYISRRTVLAFEAKAKLAARDKVGAISVNARIDSRKLVTNGIVRVNIEKRCSIFGWQPTSKHYAPRRCRHIYRPAEQRSFSSKLWRKLPKA